MSNKKPFTTDNSVYRIPKNRIECKYEKDCKFLKQVNTKHTNVNNARENCKCQFYHSECDFIIRCEDGENCLKLKIKNCKKYHPKYEILCKDDGYCKEYPECKYKHMTDNKYYGILAKNIYYNDFVRIVIPAKNPIYYYAQYSILTDNTVHIAYYKLVNKSEIIKHTFNAKGDIVDSNGGTTLIFKHYGDTYTYTYYNIKTKKLYYGNYEYTRDKPFWNNLIKEIDRQKSQKSLKFIIQLKRKDLFDIKFNFK